MMQPKDLLVFLEKGDRTMEHLKEGNISSWEPTSTTIDLEYYRRLMATQMMNTQIFGQGQFSIEQQNQAAQKRYLGRLTGF